MFDISRLIDFKLVSIIFIIIFLNVMLKGLKW